jgi:hypothetical protein
MKISGYYFICSACLIISACQPQTQKESRENIKQAVKPEIAESEEDKVVALVMDLDEVKRKSAQVVKDSKNKRHLVTYIETPPTADDPYYWVKVAEDNGGSYVTYYSFAVHKITHNISYYDVMQDSLISIAQWRKITSVDER